MFYSWLKHFPKSNNIDPRTKYSNDAKQLPVLTICPVESFKTAGKKTFMKTDSVTRGQFFKTRVGASLHLSTSSRLRNGGARLSRAAYIGANFSVGVKSSLKNWPRFFGVMLNFVLWTSTFIPPHAPPPPLHTHIRKMMTAFLLWNVKNLFNPLLWTMSW
jgi:hypothetical protein